MLLISDSNYIVAPVSVSSISIDTSSKLYSILCSCLIAAAAVVVVFLSIPSHFISRLSRNRFVCSASVFFYRSKINRFCSCELLLLIKSDSHMSQMWPLKPLQSHINLLFIDYLKTLILYLKWNGYVCLCLCVIRAMRLVEMWLNIWTNPHLITFTAQFTFGCCCLSVHIHRSLAQFQFDSMEFHVKRFQVPAISIWVFWINIKLSFENENEQTANQPTTTRSKWNLQSIAKDHTKPL